VIDMTEVQVHIESARLTFEQMIADDAVFRPMIMVYRDDLMIARVMPNSPGSDGGAVIHFAAQISVALFRATDLVIVMDSYHSNLLINPMTGKEWEHGEMNDLADNHDGRAHGWVTDSITMILEDRAGANALVEMPYSVDGKTVRWKGEPILFGLPGGDSSGHAGGGRLSGLFEPPPDMPVVPDSLTDLDAARLVTASHCMVALAVYGREG